jgi:hypothetical protein
MPSLFNSPAQEIAVLNGNFHINVLKKTPIIRTHLK